MPPDDFAASRVARPHGRRDAVIDTAVDTYEMTNLFPRNTGLPLAVWVSPRGRARHDARVKVCLTPGKMDVDSLAVVAIRPRPRLLAGRLGSPEFDQVARWIELNEAALIEFWDEAIDSIELGAKLKKLDADDSAA